MISLDVAMLGLFMTALIGAYFSHRYGERSYDDGFMDAVQLHNEGRLTYSSVMQEDGIELLTIEVSDED